MSQTNLTCLARQAAAGDVDARRALERRIVPLIETVVRRWHKQQQRARSRPPADDAPASHKSTSPAISADEVRRITSAVLARTIRQLMPPPRGAVRGGDETLVAGHLLDTLVGSALAATG